MAETNKADDEYKDECMIDVRLPYYAGSTKIVKIGSKIFLW